MKKIVALIIVIFSIHSLSAQTAPKPLPRFENDTLYTSCGYKIYKGDTLHFGYPTRKRDGNFRFIRIISSTGSFAISNKWMIVEKMSDYGVSELGNVYIKIKGKVKFHDGLGTVKIHMNFDKAIESLPGLPSELIVPDEFKPKEIESPADEINKLYKLYQDSVINKEEFDAAKAKVLAQ